MIKFGTDGIRGKYLEDIDPDIAFYLGRAISRLECNTVVVAYDTRLSCEDMFAGLKIGSRFCGMNFIDGGIVPTPALINHSKKNNILGVMITASHNGHEDNGLKVVKNGFKIQRRDEELVEMLMTANMYKHLGGEESVFNLENEYLNFLREHKVSSSLKIAIDCANGATYKTAPAIFSEITKNLFVSADKPDGENINAGVGSTHVEHILNFTKENKCDIGFAFDGDGDRLVVVENGRVFDGDEIIYIIANYLKSKNQLNKNTVVLTIMSNLAILQKYDEIGIKYILTDVGDKHVCKQLVDNDYSLGGESSGHVIIPSLSTTGDGTLVAMTLVKIMEETKKTLSELIGDVKKYPSDTVDVITWEKDTIETKTFLNRVKEIEKTFNGKGQVIARASGTERLIRVTVTAESMELVEKYTEELAELIYDLECGE